MLHDSFFSHEPCGVPEKVGLEREYVFLLVYDNYGNVYSNEKYNVRVTVE